MSNRRVTTVSSKRKQRLVKFVSAIVLPVVYVGFVITEHAGVWDRLHGLDLVEDVAGRLETSYAEGVDRQIGPDEEAWEPLIKLIYEYSNVELPMDKEPKMVARYVAISSAKIELGKSKFAEWTAPATPIVVLYRERTGQEVSPEDVRLVGSIGDIRTWIRRSKNDFKFLVHDLFLGMFSLGIGVMVWRIDNK
jgi:hypothetical protein